MWNNAFEFVFILQEQIVSLSSLFQLTLLVKTHQYPKHRCSHVGPCLHPFNSTPIGWIYAASGAGNGQLSSAMTAHCPLGSPAAHDRTRYIPAPNQLTRLLHPAQLNDDLSTLPKSDSTQPFFTEATRFSHGYEVLIVNRTPLWSRADTITIKVSRKSGQ